MQYQSCENLSRLGQLWVSCRTRVLQSTTLAVGIIYGPVMWVYNPSDGGVDAYVSSHVLANDSLSQPIQQPYSRSEIRFDVICSRRSLMFFSISCSCHSYHYMTEFISFHSSAQLQRYTLIIIRFRGCLSRLKGLEQQIIYTPRLQ